MEFRAKGIRITRIERIGADRATRGWSRSGREMMGACSRGRWRPRRPFLSFQAAGASDGAAAQGIFAILSILSFAFVFCLLPLLPSSIVARVGNATGPGKRQETD